MYGKSKPDYEFIPYKYGCYSFSANADLKTLIEKKVLSEKNNTYYINEDINYISSLKEDDRKKLSQTKLLYGKFSSEQLIRHTYLNFPFYAINSLIAPEILSAEQLKNVNKKIPIKKDTTLYTIGYEGLSVEAYLLKLIKNDIKALIDVRNKPQSMKYGFSKKTLSAFCESIGIQYYHFPEVGIESNQRQNLDNQSDYEVLFQQYRKNCLTTTLETQTKIIKLLNKHKRIALTCFEENHNQCHRKHLANALIKLEKNKYKLINI